MNASGQRVVLAVALPGEARPLLDAWSLKRDTNLRPFAVYHHRDWPLSLLVSGVGKMHMAVAIGCVHQQLNCTNASYYINIGVAGSAVLPYGSLIIADKVIDQATRRVYFPFVAHETMRYLTQVTSYDMPVSNYPPLGVVDMEAAGFFASASLFVTREQLLSIKIVSDTSEAQRDALNRQQLEALIAAKFSVIDALVQKRLQQVCAADMHHLAIDKVLQQFMQRWHFTTCQQHQLMEQLRRWQTLLPDTNPLAVFSDQPCAKSVLTVITEHLAQRACSW